MDKNSVSSGEDKDEVLANNDEEMKTNNDKSKYQNELTQLFKIEHKFF